MNLDFLSNVQMDEVQKLVPKAKVSTAKLPTEADLRVFPNGRVYPSEAFAAKYDLEFQPKVLVGEELEVVGNGLEIFSSKNWGMVMGRMPVELMFCAAIPKSMPKVDMWASTKYDENNLPKASVFTQGSNTFASTVLVPMIADIYGVDWDTTEYVDMKVVFDKPMVSSNGLYHLPKTVSTGVNKGKEDYIRRENLTICPLVIAEVVAAGAAPAIISTNMFTEQPKAEFVPEPAGEDWALGMAQPAAEADEE